MPWTPGWTVKILVHSTIQPPDVHLPTLTWSEGEGGRVSISHHLTSRFKFTLWLCLMPSKVGIYVISRSGWLKIHQIFSVRGQRWGRTWTIIDDYKSLSYKQCLLKNAFSVFNFDILSVIYTLCIFLSCTSEVLLFALNVMQFDNVL